MNQLSRVYYTKPSITDLEVGYVTDAARHGWGEQCYEYINRFETQFSSHLQVKYAIATSSATGALHLGMAALGIGLDDEVILGDINWIASAAPIFHLGAKPVPVDVLSGTWCLDPIAVEAAITSRTKAILAVHLYGNLCDLDALQEIGRRHNIPVIEDAAEAIGSIWHDRRAGSIGIFGAFSFHGTKTLTTGEGGVFVTNDSALYDRVLTLSNHGRTRGETRQFWPATVGYKYKMSNLQAAIGCAQLERVEELVARKRAIFDYYHDAFRSLPLKMNPEPEGTRNGFWMPTVVVDSDVSFDREQLLTLFKEKNIDGRVFFWPLSLLSMFEPSALTPVAHDMYRRAMNLPSYHDMTAGDQDRVIECIFKLFGS